MNDMTWQQEREEREERERPMRQFTQMEADVLRECAGLIPPRPWGAALGATLEELKGSGYITSHFGGELTDKGKEMLVVVQGVGYQYAGATPQPVARNGMERLSRRTDAEVMAELSSSSPLNKARQVFSSWCGKIDQAGSQRRPLSPIELRRMELEAVEAIAAALKEGR